MESDKIKVEGDRGAALRSSTVRVVSGFLLIGVLGYLDYATGFEISFSVFYLAPVVIVTWYGSRGAGLAASLLAAATWQFANHLAGERFSYSFIYIWNAGTRLGLFAVVTILLTRLKDALERERTLSRTDYLTGMANSRLFYERAQLELDRCRRYDRPLSIAYIDLDNFKRLNDLVGHVAGDEALRLIARTFLGQLRASDLVARLGGDEFAVLLPETEETSANQAILRLHDAALAEVRAHQWPLTFSIGLITYRSYAPGLDQMIRAVDALMYKVKESGKDHIESLVV